ncbi:3-oxoadipate enol-lactonase [Phaeobacter sp.]|uniref:3-oxoadipate enol-lactonase n=1 Tax=Phaeobacter sp. TaxID=1902409 RepID=UPI0025CE6466|nr:3-oxoadipate enol-lactonase [Phaeobacter sp.]
MPDFLRANGRLHHYRFRKGTGDTNLVLVNSLGTDLRTWDAVLSHLPDDLSVLSYDKSGHGLSECGATTTDEFAADLESLMEILGINSALVCGVSFGGMIAQALAAKRPNLVQSLVLSNTGLRIGTPETWSERIEVLRQHGLAPMADAILERWFAPAFRNRYPDTTFAYRMMLTRTPTEGYMQVCDAIRTADLSVTSAQITCPTLCIAGSEDLATPPATVRLMTDVIQGSQFKCYDGVGHLPCIEAPDRFAKDLLIHAGYLK